jgi:hypothetical protein
MSAATMTPPRSLQVLRDVLPTLSPSAGAFDPYGSWEHRYAVWCLSETVTPQILAQGEDPYKVYYHSWGGLRLRRAPAENQGITLQVVLLDTLLDHTESRADTTIHCRGDALASPVAWEQTSRLERHAGVQSMPPIVSRGSFAANRMHYEVQGCKRERAVATTCATLWGLFDAVQRLSPSAAMPGPFDLLEDFRTLKPGHRLVAMPEAVVRLATGETRLLSPPWATRPCAPPTWTGLCSGASRSRSPSPPIPFAGRRGAAG